MDRCTTCGRDYGFALDWGTCPNCKEMYQRGYAPAYSGGRRVWRKKRDPEPARDEPPASQGE